MYLNDIRKYTKNKNGAKEKSQLFKKNKLLLLLVINILFTSKFYRNIKNKNNINKRNKDYHTKKFAFIRRIECPICGLFSFYNVNLGCINKYLTEGYIPIVDLKSFNNIYNKNNISTNPWELFFYQPFNYTMNEVQRYAKNITYLICTSKFYRPDEINIYNNQTSINFWHEFAKTYMPVKNEIIYESKIIMKKLFNNSKNILGVKLRGTDYTYMKPKWHPIPPKVEIVISDVKSMDKQYKYDYIFFTSEDEIIKQKFIPQFKEKIKLLNPNVFVKYNGSTITLNEKIIGNVKYIKNYLLNIIILSKCLDFVSSKGSGATGVLILTNGFRHIKIYDLGLYKRFR